MRIFCYSAIFFCPVATSAAADSVIDQEYVAPTVIAYILDYPGDYMAQTFTVRNSGQITSIGLQISAGRHSRNPFTDDLHFKLTRTNSLDEPLLDQVLATYDISPNRLPSFYGGLPMTEFDLRNQDVRVRAGESLALVLTTNHTYYSHPDQPQYWWNRSIKDGIPGGRFYLYSPNVFGPYWFYKWTIPDRSIWLDAGYRITIDAVPEPNTIWCSGTLFAILAMYGRRRPILGRR